MEIPSNSFVVSALMSASPARKIAVFEGAHPIDFMLSNRKLLLGKYPLVAQPPSAATASPFSNHPRPLQHRMQQHVAPGRNVLRLRIFNLVVADAVFAGDKNHAGRG